MQAKVVVQQYIYVQCGMHICAGAYANIVKCMYSSVPGHIVDCIEFI